jgi:hypothetical protein
VRVRDGDGAVAEVVCRVVVDAAGRSSRFSRRRPTGAYGVQFESSAARTRVLRFGFYRWGYGGSVSVEQGRVNSCFLVGGEHLSRFSDRPGHRVTGPIGYELLEGPYLTVGDAAGMIDPFCGEGMRHAVESGCLAAETLWDGFRSGASPGEIRSRYRAEWRRRWAAKRLLSRRLRWIFSREWAARAGLRLTGTCPAIARTCLEELWR